MASTHKKLQNQLRAMAETHGFSLARTTNHLIWRHQSGAQVVTPKTPSDHRAMKNCLRDFRHAVQRHEAAFA